MSRKRLDDGWDALKWLEVTDFLVWCGVDVTEAGLDGFSVALDVHDQEGARLTVYFQGGRQVPLLLVDGFTLYRRPEFRALCERLGINLELYTKAITVTVRDGGHPTAVHTYALLDCGPTTSKADSPSVVEGEKGNVIDTTVLNNEHFVTRVPRSNPGAR